MAFNVKKLRAKSWVFYRSSVRRVQKRPMASFFASLLLLLIAIIGSKILFTPKVTEEKKPILTKTVEIYQVGSIPKISFQGQVKKVGVVKLVSQTSAVVQSVNVSEGQHVKRGQNLINLSTNFEGANAAAVQAQMAARQYQHVKDTLPTQIDLINKQRDLANTIRDNSSNLATISAQSTGETQSLINLNQDILNKLYDNLNNLRNNGGSSTEILQAEQAISGFQAGQNQLQSALRNLSYSTNTNNAPAHLSDLQRDITVKGLDIQEKSLALNRDISKLQLTLANISASFFHPTSPVSGVVERIFVNPLDIVNPGSALVTIVGTNKTVELVVLLPADTAQRLSHIQPATLHFKRAQVDLVPSFVSTIPTDGQLYSVLFTIPEEYFGLVSDGDFLQVDLPLGEASDVGSYFVPLDALVQTQDQALVYIANKNKVETKIVTLGNVSGRFVLVTSGLNGLENVILNRNVVEGDEVTPH